MTVDGLTEDILFQRRDSWPTIPAVMWPSNDFGCASDNMTHQRIGGSQLTDCLKNSGSMAGSLMFSS
ncbi:hypothetical protein [Paraburkholderia sp. BR14374]|uniref:hypothetical protein n=1 Tax=Paraburkholderia sp. BR14374 TaxID=3237007 RepID=UPI0034CD14BD